MKNLPEQDFWNSIRNRLLQYKEEPDDDWDKIAGALASVREDHQGYSKASDVFVIVLFAFLLGFVVGGNRLTDRSDKLVSKTILPEELTMAKKTVEVQTADQNDRSEPLAMSEPGPADTAVNKTSIRKNENSPSPELVSQNFLVDKHSNEVESRIDNLLLSVNVERENVMHESNDKASHEVDQSLKSDSDSGEEEVVVKKDSVLAVRNVASPTPKEQKTKKKKFRPSVYFVASPTLGFHKVIPITDDQVEVRSLERKGIFSGDRLGFQLEAGFQMVVARNLELYASGSYYQNEQTVSYTYSDPTRVSIGSADADLSYTLTPGESTASVMLKQKSIGGGVGLMYHIRGRKLMHKIGCGLQLMQGLTRHTSDEIQSKPLSRSFNYNLFYRLEYAIHSRTSVFIQPSFTRSIFTNQKLNAPFDVKPYHVGMGIGVLYHF